MILSDWLITIWQRRHVITQSDWAEGRYHNVHRRVRVCQFLIGDRIHLINQIGWRQALRWVTSIKELESDSELLLRLREIVHFDIVSEDILTWGIASQVLRAIKVLDELLSNIEINAVYRDASSGSLSIDASD